MLKLLNVKVGLLQKATLKSLERRIMDSIKRLKERDKLIKTTYEISASEYKVLQHAFVQYEIEGHYRKADVRAFASINKMHVAEMEIDRDGVTIIDHSSLGQDTIWELIKFPNGIFSITDKKYNKEVK